MSGNDFDCNSCGACCKLIPDEALELYGLPISESGGCANLMPDNRCAIYKDRPWICDVRKVWETRKNVSWEDYKTLTHRACELLRSMLEKGQ